MDIGNSSPLGCNLWVNRPCAKKCDVRGPFEGVALLSLPTTSCVASQFTNFFSIVLIIQSAGTTCNLNGGSALPTLQTEAQYV
jgi:hypothetical protein